MRWVTQSCREGQEIRYLPNNSAILRPKLSAKSSLRSATCFASRSRLGCHVTDANSATDCSASLILLAGWPSLIGRESSPRDESVRLADFWSYFLFNLSDPPHPRNLSRRSLGVGGSVVLKVSDLPRNLVPLSVLYSVKARNDFSMTRSHGRPKQERKLNNE
jgi:hypothetical protein